MKTPSQIELEKIPADVSKIDFTLSIYDAEIRGQNFSAVNAAIKIIDESNCNEILKFEFGENFSNETAIVAGEIYRHNGNWKFNAVGAGFKGGLKSLCKDFGIDTD